MRGSVVKKNDRWYVVIEDRDPATGARKRRWHSGFRTKREAQAACNELVVAIQRGDYLQANRQTVGEFAVEWLATIAPTVRTFLKATRDDELSALWMLIAATGPRRGEALRLRWSDVDLDTGRAQINQTVIAIGWNVHVGQPKTQAGRRPIALDPATIEVLRKHRRTIPLHGLRHTWATLALQMDVHPRVVQERLGHSNIAITLQTYSHVLPIMHDSAAATVAALFMPCRA